MKTDLPKTMQRAQAWCRAFDEVADQLYPSVDLAEQFCANLPTSRLNAELIKSLDKIQDSLVYLEKQDLHTPGFRLYKDLEALLLDLDALVQLDRKSTGEWAQLILANGFQTTPLHVIEQLHQVQPVLAAPSWNQWVFQRNDQFVALLSHDVSLAPTNVLVAPQGFQADEAIFIYDLGPQCWKNQVFTTLEEDEPIEHDRYQHFATADKFLRKQIPYSLFDHEMRNFIEEEVPPNVLFELPGDIFYYLVGDIERVGWIGADKTAALVKRQPRGSL